jgi:hypothetical protein
MKFFVFASFHRRIKYMHFTWIKPAWTITIWISFKLTWISAKLNRRHDPLFASIRSPGLVLNVLLNCLVLP